MSQIGDNQKFVQRFFHALLVVAANHRCPYAWELLAVLVRLVVVGVVAFVLRGVVSVASVRLGLLLAAIAFLRLVVLSTFLLLLFLLFSGSVTIL